MAEAKRHSRRQAARRAVIFVAFLLFPVVLNFLSPYVIIDGAAHGIVNGSFVVFGLLFVSALFLGRLWCAWACPGAGMQEACFMINDRPARGGRLNWIKWGIWFPWIGAIALAAISAGGYRAVNLLYLTESGISVDEPAKYVIYYVVVGLVFVLALTTGRRGFCHYACWMAPFMVFGRRIRNALNTPALRLQADAGKCIECGRCTKGCPMSLAVQQMVLASAMEDGECILCGSCVDICPKQAIRYTFSAGR